MVDKDVLIDDRRKQRNLSVGYLGQERAFASMSPLRTSMLELMKVHFWWNLYEVLHLEYNDKGLDNVGVQSISSHLVRFLFPFFAILREIRKGYLMLQVVRLLSYMLV